MVKVKICGLMDTLSVLTAVDAGADFIGLVFAKSKRRITLEKAKELASIIPSNIKKVGVFVNEKKEVIEEIAEEVGLDYIQLHGDETPDFCAQLSLPIIKAFSVASVEDVEKVKGYPCDYYLLDSPHGKYRGGNGTTFDWSLVKNQAFLKDKMILAGGLTVENVAEAINEVKPIGVDVSSGVETNGVKDTDKIRAFLLAAKKGETNGKI
ncbi:phosphoribosylanthranilate isomerase [Gracilibacillus marinus]|uniref:N-(5'-phosphoribosyl)anthranilate isomerase n=1 Tax=Gracilibacillus marinus TaxID=630535 RepID=A0ABV8VT10_9BACI